MLMKRMLLLAVLAGIAAGTAGCKQQDAPKLDRQAVRLYVGDQVRITADRPVAWSAADDFYAAVDADGTVTARHVGTTTVTATADSGSAVCTVEVQPRYDTFEEPLYNYLSLHPLSVLKEAETREILEQNDKEIVYKGVAPLEKISYSIVWQDEMPFVLNAVAYISSVAYLDECIALWTNGMNGVTKASKGKMLFGHSITTMPVTYWPILLIPILRLLICGLSILLSQRTYQLLTNKS